MGPLPLSSRGNLYLVVFQDTYAKRVQCHVIRKLTKALRKEVISRFGCADTVITNNGTQCTGKIFRSFLKEGKYTIVLHRQPIL